jgi:predicted amidohydrolase YtcJ
VDRLADVGAVVQHPVEVLLVDPVAPWRADTAFRNLQRQFRPRSDFEEAGEDPADVFGMLVVDDELPVLLGPERAARCCQIRSLLDAGAEMVAGTDWPAAAPDANPWTGLAGMISRRDPTGTYPGVVGREQAIPLERALPIYIANGARALGMEGETGRLTAGHWADFIVLPGDLRAMTTDEIGAIEVEETVWKGQSVYAA